MEIGMSVPDPDIITQQWVLDQGLGWEVREAERDRGIKEGEREKWEREKKRTTFPVPV